MLHLLEIPLIFPKGKRIHPSMGSIFHGALMERLGPQLATFFHEKGMRPYSQAVFWDPKRKEAIWHLGTLTDALSEILQKVLPANDSVYLRQQGYAVSLKKIQHTSFHPEQMMQMSGPPPTGAVLHFHTTTSFKRNGSHVLFPEPELLYRSIISRLALVSLMRKSDLDDGLPQVLSYYTIITDYDLRTEIFQLEGHGVKGFSGTLKLRFGGELTTRYLAGMLLNCGNFTGFGVKTALGMGATSIQLQYKK